MCLSQILIGSLLSDAIYTVHGLLRKLSIFNDICFHTYAHRTIHSVVRIQIYHVFIKKSCYVHNFVKYIDLRVSDKSVPIHQQINGILYYKHLAFLNSAGMLSGSEQL